MKKCLIYIEKNYEKDGRDLLGAAERIFEENFESTAVLTDADIGWAEGFFDEAIKIKGSAASGWNVRSAALAIRELSKNRKVDCILFAATQFGRMLAPYTAALFECGLVADVTAIERQEDEVEMIRPAFGGRIMAVVKKTGSGPVMMSVRPGVFLYTKDPNKQTKQSSFDYKDPAEEKMSLIEKRPKPAQKDIRESEILVSGGGGAMDNFELLKELADRLNGAVSASRMAVDNGKADRMIQVGQSGRFVHPKLYIAEGIYGALQHVAGIKKAEHIITVNTDPKAPICSLADIIVEADAAEFTRKLIERIDRDKETTVL